ncbi:hypothetical protein B0H11DRAFT_83693 [Mycena galericulata]|nr:hypothetical protein B0H11DRAFT_83693 [Mycena galericulata]
MASERTQEPPIASTSRVGDPSTSASIDQRSRVAAESESNSAPETGHPGYIAIRAATGSPGPESPRPISSHEIPTDDEHSRLRDAARGSFPRLPQHPEHIKIEIPQQAALAPNPTQHDVPSVPRPSIYHNNSQHRSDLDWIIPVEPKRERPKTLYERLLPTLETARAERAKYEWKAKMTAYALNAAIGMQVVLGSLTTGLSAATSGRQTSLTIAVLGGLSTVVASYLARARGSNEPELSIARCKDLDQYIRECETFMMDLGHLTDNEHDQRLNKLRERFEELLGNGNGERRLAPV